MTLRRLLEHVENGPVRTVGELSRDLEIDRELVCAMVDHLVGIGLLNRASRPGGAGGASCAGCPASARCQVIGPVDPEGP